MATDVSLIADAKAADLRIEPRRGRFRRWFVAFFVVAIILAGLVFGGIYISKERYLGVIHTQAVEVLNENNIHRHSESPTARVCIAASDGDVRVEVEDRDKGIPPEKQFEMASTGTPG